MTFDLCIIGAGAAGCVAAITAGRNGKSVLLLEAKDKIASKLYRTGNGKCNLTNLRMGEDCFFSDAEEGVLQRLSPMDAAFLMRFFEDLGVVLYARDGYVYPRTEQASTIVQALQTELSRLSVTIKTGVTVGSIKREHPSAGPFLITDKEGETYTSEMVLIATGGLAGEKDAPGDLGYAMARSCGHSVYPLYPVLVPLYTSPEEISLAFGVRCHAQLTLLVDGKEAASESGQLQIIRNGLSGIPVFQISHLAGKALQEGKEVRILVDFLPDVQAEVLAERIETSVKEAGEETLGMILNGLLHDKLIRMILALYDLQPEMKVRNFLEKREDAEAILHDVMLSMKSLSVPVTHTGDFTEAQVTAGGVPLKEVTKEGASLLQEGLFLAGEILNVDGICGGYNLTHAFLSGIQAGNACSLYPDGRS
ncbi:MAG: aminoacetone oxidase family FAD-binding enzyme [Lachnospiraceae bacterium]|nr:aminoacetone oxidase family FAD-binding enzyme [Lachnospiraceae bacterium]